MQGEDLEEDSILSDWFGPITWAKVVLAAVVLISILVCCGINGSNPEFWEWLGND